jgi:UDP:flavonoid glycosyltransferase YjiC (YdhE family)
MFGALAHGLGQLVLPQSADNFVNADARAGYGMRLLAEQVSPASVADAVRTLLTDPWRARRAATEIAATPRVSSAAR